MISLIVNVCASSGKHNVFSVASKNTPINEKHSWNHMEYCMF